MNIHIRGCELDMDLAHKSNNTINRLKCNIKEDKYEFRSLFYKK
jgi:hypothetical protein